MNRSNIRVSSSLLGCFLLTGLLGCDVPGGGQDEVVRLGLIVPTDTVIPPLRDAAFAFVRVAQTAVDELNAHGGVNGREVVLIIRDETFDPPTGKFGEGVVDVIDELEELGAVGAIGPVTTATASSAWPEAMARGFPLISPSSTGVSLAEVQDGGFLFRNATNDKVQGLIMAHYLTKLHDDPGNGEGVDPITCALVIHEDSNYGRDFATAFVDIFETQLGNKVVINHQFTVTDPDGEEGPNPPELTAADWDAINNAELCDAANPDAPRNVILIALDDAVNVTVNWDKLDPRPNIRWFLSDGARTPGFTQAAPASMDNVVGTAPTNPVLGEAYEVLERAYGKRYPGENIAELAYTPQVWDGVFLFAAALTLQDERNPDGTFGGLGLARAIRDVSNGPGAILHAGQWRDLLAAVGAGAEVDFDGAAGPTDFDDCGESFGAYEIFRVLENPAAGQTDQPNLLSEQVTFISPAKVQELIGTVQGIDNECSPF